MKKTFKKLAALMGVAAMVMGLTFTANAAKITINRDSSWNKDENTLNKKATFTYYKIFDAKVTKEATVNEETGSNDGKGIAVYTISGNNAADKVAALPDIFTKELAADGKYYITLTDNTTQASVIVDALETMVEANPTLFPGTEVISDDNPVVIEGLDSAYYLILASNGQKAAVQTIGDVTINEKNDYPRLDKQQKKEADQEYFDVGVYQDNQKKVEAEIGKVIDYKLIVTIPAEANKAIDIIDTMSEGLDFNGFASDKFTAKIDDTAVEYSQVSPQETGSTFHIRFADSVVAANQGKQIIIEYSATVNASALVDDKRNNTVTLKYDEGNYVLWDKVEYTTYFTGIEKVDGADHTKKLEDVEFTLTEDGVAFNVTKNTDGYYIPGGDSNVVKTDANGKIIIRGLDNTKTYVITETKTLAEYNLLKDPKTLELVEDTGNAVTTATFDQVENNKGSELPSTGGMGTTIFYVIGGILILAAAIILISRRRVQQ